LTIVVHGDTNLMVVGPQTMEIDTLVYMWGVISRKRHKIGIQLLWRTYRKSQAVYRTVTSTLTLSNPLTPKWPIFDTLRPPFVSLAQVKLTTSKSVQLLTKANT